LSEHTKTFSEHTPAFSAYADLTFCETGDVRGSSVLVFALTACAGAQTQHAAPSPNVAPSATLDETPNRDEPETPPTLTGIASCDEYIATYEACRDRLRAEEMSGERPVFESHRAHIEEQAQQGDPQLATACSAMLKNIQSKCAP
jgi:hypothetical protein